MLVISSPKGAAAKITWGDHSVVAFTDDAKKADATITFVSAPEDEPTEGVISWPGEYDISDIAIRGIEHGESGQISFVAEMDGNRIALLSSPLQELADHELELLGDIDVLVIPANNAKLVQKVLDEVDPRMVIPVPGGDEFDEVLKVCGAQNVEVEKEHKVKGLPAEGRSVVVLS